MKKYFFLPVLFFSLACTSNLEEDSYQDKLTVESVIEEGEFARVYLLNSIPFKGVIDSLEVIKSIETKAKVVLSNGEVSEILTLKKDESYFPFFYYRSNVIKGDLNKSYNLSINVRNKEFTSKTDVPQAPHVVDVEFIEAQYEGEVFPDFRDVKLTMQNSNIENLYFKFFIKNEAKKSFSNANPFIINTEIIDSNTFSVIIRHFKDTEGDGKEEFLEVGTKVDLKIVAITKEQYEFWKSVKGDQTTILGSSSFSSNAKSNISNNAFGYWSGENAVTFNLEVM
ncbi:DUF4249 family protein [Tamlana sp. 2_MG-2023]|uniref:DUF4249 family protein n=1 Tax=unclassified Tamlana TaxID=2614803 RepID=UPI0026E443E7|nr:MULTISPECIES: DUF4249 family protein [unclassified Tamlana]MDO6759016.1 DUF4249 family protein [Tamlana sp. 2_MG-2023]MDO6789715.1 DUF4249 family protein [Tamlana sp. 1_MG-2023]